MKTSLRISRSTAILIVCLAGVYWHYSRQPLHHTDLWGHLAYGRWIVEHGRLPATEPFMPLARGVPLIDTAWFWQVVAYRLYLLAGFTGLQVLHAASVTACCGLLAWSVAHRTQRTCLGGLAIAGFVALEWFQFRIIRPQMAGLFCFVALDVLLNVRALRRRAGWAVPLLFLVWANLHGSFITGLALIVLRAAGRAMDVAIRERSSRRALRDRRLIWLIRLAFSAAVAVILNPYGPRLYVEVLSFSQNPNLRDLLEWMRLSFATWQGQAFVATSFLLIAAGIAAGRRISAGTWLPVIAFGTATVWSARMIVWWSPLAASLLAIQADAAWRRLQRRHDSRADDRRARTVLVRTPLDTPPSTSEVAARAPRLGHLWTGVAGAAIIVALLASPFGQMRGDRGAEPSLLSVSPSTPVAAVEWLRENPPAGLVFNNYEWGDFLVWAGPADVEPFVTSHVHLIPPSVWRDYRGISRGDPDCLDRLDAYQVDTVLLDGARQSRLAERLAAGHRWSRRYGDSHAVIFIRRPD